MPLVFACGVSHAPGITAWPEAAPTQQAEKVIGSYRQLSKMLHAARPEALLALTVEHWANFFLNQMPTYCIGRADHYEGPVEEWLRIPRLAFRVMLNLPVRFSMPASKEDSTRLFQTSSCSTTPR